MRQRCENPKVRCWRYYGGRGITICPRWQDFATFLADMGPRPSDAHSIERKDNDGPYSPDNCCWATRSQQALNKGGKRPAFFITHAGETLHIYAWATRTGIPWRTIYGRLRQKGWTVERALTTPLHANKQAHHPHNRWMKRAEG